MKELIAEFVGERTWALVGASADPRKFGHKILVDLRQAGYKVYPVNPKGGEIEGEKVYPTLRDLPEKPAVVDIVVPPAITEKIVQECAALDIRRVWMQPSAESEAAIQYCQEHGIKVVHHACAMMNKRYWPDRAE